MKNTSKRRTCTFQLAPHAAEVLSEWDKSGQPRTVLLNGLLSRFGPDFGPKLLKTLRENGLAAGPDQRRRRPLASLAT